MKILVTGTAGFIGYHLIKRLLERGDEVVGLDNINDYYDLRVKYGRLEDTGIENVENIDYGKLIQSKKYDNYKFIKLNLEDKENLDKLFENCEIDYKELKEKIRIAINSKLQAEDILEFVVTEIKNSTESLHETLDFIFNYSVEKEKKLNEIIDLILEYSTKISKDGKIIELSKLGYE